MKNAWNHEAMRGLSELEQLAERSRLIGREPKLCVWGGGNTSSKIREKDFRGIEREVLRIKGSGSDLKSCSIHDFTPLDLEGVLPVRKRDRMSDRDMVAYLAACQLNPKAPRASIEALLHAFVPHPHIDHTHADAILAVTNQRKGRELARRLYQEKLLWIPYVKPGFELAKRVADAFDASPQCHGVILEKHGLITWGRTSRESYSRTIRYVSVAERYFNGRRKGVRTDRRGFTRHVLSPEDKKSWLLERYSIIRRILSRNKGVILAFTDAPPVMKYVNHRHAAQFSQEGPATPDHMLRTKRAPLLVKLPGENPKKLRLKMLADQIRAYAASQERYFHRFKSKGMTLLDPYPKVILIPGVGMITAGKDLKSAKVIQEVYMHAMQVQMDADLVSGYRSMSLKQQFEMEYWDLELYKLSKSPPDKELARQVAVVTGATGVIGRAICKELVGEGAHVAVTDLSERDAKGFAGELNRAAGREVAGGFGLDVTRESSVRSGMEKALCFFGGIDILVSNAGVAKVAAIQYLELADWEQSFAVNATGHFLVSRFAIRLMRRQGTGGSIVYMTTKNILAPGKDFGAYSASKAAEAQLARIVAIENGEYGIRSNMVNPDGIFEGSGLWSENLRKRRAKSYGIHINQLEDYYRNRNLLKAKVTAEDVARSVAFLVGPRAAKTTGCILTVDGGVREAFPR